jgi:PAS domain S-box-containing protein
VHEQAALTPDQLRENGGEDALAAALSELQIHQAELEIQNEHLQETQERLASLSEMYHKLFYDAPVGYVCVDETGIITNANRVAAQLLGFDRAEARGLLYECFPKDHHQTVWTMLDLVRTNGAAHGFELRVVRSKGGERVLQADAISAGASFETYVTLTDVTEAHENRTALAEALEQNRLMSRENYHRIMNNLDMLVALVQLQLAQVEHDAARGALESVSSRIEAIIRSQAALRGLEGQGQVDLVKHLDRFVKDLVAGVGSAHELTFESRVRSLAVSSDTALYVSLVVNELVTNAVKYAYPEGGGPVAVILRSRGEAYEVIVQDNGVGLPSGKASSREGSLGLQLVGTLAQGQLGGSWSVNAENGTRHVVRFAVNQE